MNIVLTNLVLWPFVFLVAVPLLLHLFARTRPPVYKFSSIEFILRIMRKTMRIKRPQDWLLLLIRTLLYAAIIFFFMQPLFFSKRKLAGAFQSKNVVLVVDATASMAYTEGAQTRFASACAEASEILSGLTARDTANIVWIKAEPESVFPAMGVNLGFLQTALRRASVTPEAGNVREAMRMAVRLLEGIEGRKEICVISDFQKSAWENADAAVPQAIDLVKVKIGRETAVNGAVTDIYIDPPKPLVGEDVSICCEVRNFSPQPRRRTVFLNVEENRQSQDVMIPAWNKAVAVFRRRFPASGTVPVTVSLSEDSFAGDDVRWSLVEVRDFLRVGVLAKEEATAKAWRRALDSVGWARTEAVSDADSGGAGQFDALMLSGWDGAAMEGVRERLREGCTVVWSPAPGTPVARLNAAAGMPAGGASAEAMRWEQSAETHRLKLVAEKDDVFRVFASGEHGDPARGSFHGRLRFPAPADGGADILLAYEDGVPALARFRGGAGRLFLWNIPLQREASSFASQMEFVPLLAEMLLASRARTGRDGEQTEFLPGQRVAAKFESDVAAADLKLAGAGGKALAVQERRTGRDISFVSADPPEPGLYSWEYGGKMLGYSAVNFPVIESDLRALPQSQIETAGSVAVGGGRTVRQLRDGVKVWPALLALAVMLGLSEGIVLLWVERS